MSATEAHDTSSDTHIGKVDMKLEVQVIPVSDVDRSKNFWLSSRFGGDSSVREGDLDGGAAEVDHRDQRVGGVEAVCAV